MWIARNKNNELFIFFGVKPKFHASMQCWFGINGYEINPNLFPEVTFENSPQRVELKLINND